jgi:Spy/CpxP family protein refolding chaperone
MNIRKDLVVGAIALTCVAGAAQANSMHKSTSSQPQSTLSRQTTATQLTLTAQQKQQIFNAAQSLPQQNAQRASLSAGSKVPSNVTLSPLPQQAKQNAGSALQNSEIAKLQSGEVIVVNPSSKTVQAVITPQDANSTTGAGAANSMSTSPSTSQGSGMRK